MPSEGWLGPQCQTCLGPNKMQKHSDQTNKEERDREVHDVNKTMFWDTWSELHAALNINLEGDIIKHCLSSNLFYKWLVTMVLTSHDSCVCTAANHYDLCGIITPLRPYSENYDKSAFSRNRSIWCSSDTVLATLYPACRLVFRGVFPDSRLSLVQHNLCGAYHTALDRMAWCIFSRKTHNFEGWYVLPMQDILSFVQCFLIQI